MTIYDFLSNKNESIKITANSFNVVALLKAFNTLENNHDKANSVMMHSTKFE
jgi:hypothetical protein